MSDEFLRKFDRLHRGNARTKGGATPLLVASELGNTDCVKLLIDAKADLNARLRMVTPRCSSLPNKITTTA